MGVLRRRARRRRIVRAGILGGAAYHLGKSAGQQGKEPVDQQVSEDTGESKLEQLEKLGKLHDSGVLSDEEFTNEKEKILG